MMKKKKPIHLKNSGFVTADFLFSFLLAAMFTSLLFAMCFSFTIIEIAQYISYSASRAAVPSHKGYADQKKRAEKKLSALLADPELAPLFKNGWFELALKDMRLGENSSDFYQTEYGMPEIPSGFYVPAAGVRLNLKAKVLEMNLGPLGKLESETGNGFNLTIGSMLFREPSQQECNQIIQERYQKLLSLDPNYGSIAGASSSAYVPMEDNGC